MDLITSQLMLAKLPEFFELACNHKRHCLAVDSYSGVQSAMAEAAGVQRPTREHHSDTESESWQNLSSDGGADAE